MTKECNICLEKKNVINCFHGCTAKVCDDCIIKWSKVTSKVDYTCPFCKRNSEFDFNVLAQDPFSIYCITNSMKLLKKYSEKYKTNPEQFEQFEDLEELSDEIIVMQPMTTRQRLPTMIDIGGSVNIHNMGRWEECPYYSPEGTVNPLFEGPFEPLQHDVEVSFTGEETNFLSQID